MAAQREKGFYTSLNRVSSVDMLLQIVKRRRVKGRGRLWEVERLVVQRQNGKWNFIGDNSDIKL